MKTSNVKTRSYKTIETILTYFNINAYNFAKEVGVNPTIITDFKNGKIINISAPFAAKIVSRYPQININWLLTGEGEMLNGAPPTQTVRQTNSGGDNINATLSTVATGDTPDTVNALLEMLKTAQQQVATAQQQVATLADATSRQADQLAELTRIVAELTRRLP